MKTRKSTLLVASAAAFAFATGLGSAAQAGSNPPLAALGPVPVPADNPQTPEKIELGRL